MAFDKGLDRVTGVDAKHLGLDEIVASEVDFHMERMSDSQIWFALYDPIKKTAQHVTLHAKSGKLYASVTPPEPL